MTALRAVEAADPDAGLSLPGWIYHDADFFAAEKARVLRQAWQIVCHVSDVPNPGDWHALEYLGESLLVIRGDDGAVRAFTNVCRHRGSRLVDGNSGCAKKLVCPYHAWTYATDGRLTGVPGRRDYPGLRLEDHGLAPGRARGMAGLPLRPPRSRRAVGRRDDGAVPARNPALPLRRPARPRPRHAPPAHRQLEEHRRQLLATACTSPSPIPA